MKRLLTLLVIVLLVAVGYLAYTNYFSKNSSTPKLTVSPTPKGNPYEVPVVTIDQNSSTFSMSGTIPPGWMFEGSLPVRLLDKNRNELSILQAKETEPGSWMNGRPTEFTASVDYVLLADVYYVTIEKDNPSGLPENAQSFEIEVKH